MSQATQRFNSWVGPNGKRLAVGLPHAGQAVSSWICTAAQSTAASIDPLRWAPMSSSVLARGRQLSGRVLRRGLERLGYGLVRTDGVKSDVDFPADYDEHAKRLFEEVRPYTLTS